VLGNDLSQLPSVCNSARFVRYSIRSPAQETLTQKHNVMALLIKLTRSDNGSAAFSNDIVVSVRNILMIEDYQDQNGSQSRVYLENGKSLYVEETMDDILAAANEGATAGGGGLF
jgi:hypothetical protein